jgi:hypothetical protein
MLALPIVTAVLVVGITALLVPVLRFLLALYRTRCWLRSSTIPGPDAPHVLKGAAISRTCHADHPSSAPTTQQQLQQQHKQQRSTSSTNATTIRTTSSSSSRRQQTP